MSIENIKRRLSELERNGSQLGYRIFTQDLMKPDVYIDEVGKHTNLEQIGSMSLAGWDCIVISWETDDPEAIHMNWGEPEGESAANQI